MLDEKIKKLRRGDNVSFRGMGPMHQLILQGNFVGWVDDSHIRLDWGTSPGYIILHIDHIELITTPIDLHANYNRAMQGI